MILDLNLPTGGYPIYMERGALDRASELLSLDRRVLVVTDKGVPPEYAQRIAAQCREAHIITVAEGEGSKSLATLEMLLDTMLKSGFGRTDCVVAVGGGVVGDLSGFAASVFMRGIDFYNIPTTVLSQVDSSIGGKVAVNFGGVKNIVGAFWQPRAVIIDPDVLSTLPDRQIANGLAEAVKMALTSDAELFEIFERGEALKNIDTVIERSLRIKKAVVEEDEKESGLRRVLNFGHTIGHGIESCGGLYHGECVALGMLPMCSEEVRTRLLALYARYGLPTAFTGEVDRVIAALSHDKKLDGACLRTVYVPRVGSYEVRNEQLSDFAARVREVYAR